MDSEYLQKFDLHYPGIWIDGEDRDWASDIQQILSLIEGLFVEAVASYALFQPITIERLSKENAIQESRYDSCLNGLYAKAFVYNLHSIEKLLYRLCQANTHPPTGIEELYGEYDHIFGHLRHIRDSAMHIEDRGLGLSKSQKPIETNILIIGGFIDNRYTFSGSDGNQYEIEISETTLEAARRIIQDVINSYPWITIWQ